MERKQQQRLAAHSIGQKRQLKESIAQTLKVQLKIV
jgi:hypothetical protein